MKTLSLLLFASCLYLSTSIALLAANDRNFIIYKNYQSSNEPNVYTVDLLHPELGLHAVCHTGGFLRSSVGVLGSDRTGIFRINTDGTTDTLYNLSSFDNEGAEFSDSMTEYNGYLFYLVCRGANEQYRNRLLIFRLNDFSKTSEQVYPDSAEPLYLNNREFGDYVLGDNGDVLTSGEGQDSFAYSDLNPPLPEMIEWNTGLQAYRTTTGVMNADGTMLLSNCGKVAFYNNKTVGDETRIVTFESNRIIVTSRQDGRILNIINTTLLPLNFANIALYGNSLVMMGLANDFYYQTMELPSTPDDLTASLPTNAPTLVFPCMGPKGLLYGWVCDTTSEEYKLMAIDIATGTICGTWKNPSEEVPHALRYDSTANVMVIGGPYGMNFTLDDAGVFRIRATYSYEWTLLGSNNDVNIIHVGYGLTNTIVWQDVATGRYLKTLKSTDDLNTPYVTPTHLYDRGRLYTNDFGMAFGTATYDRDSDSVVLTPINGDYSGLIDGWELLGVCDNPDIILVYLPYPIVNKYIYNVKTGVSKLVQTPYGFDVLRRTDTSAGEPDGWYCIRDGNIFHLAPDGTFSLIVNEVYYNVFLNGGNYLIIKNGTISGNIPHCSADAWGNYISGGGNSFIPVKDFGDYYRNGNWYYFYKLDAWMYSVGDFTSDGVWFYDFKMGWLWTSKQFMPIVYSCEENGWLYWYPSNIANYSFYDYDNNLYVTHGMDWAPQSLTMFSFTTDDGDYWYSRSADSLVVHSDDIQLSTSSFTFTKTSANTCRIELSEMMPEMGDSQKVRGTITLTFTRHDCGTIQINLIFSVRDAKGKWVDTPASYTGTFELKGL